MYIGLIYQFTYGTCIEWLLKPDLVSVKARHHLAYPDQQNEEKENTCSEVEEFKLLFGVKLLWIWSGLGLRAGFSSIYTKLIVYIVCK